MHLAPRMTSPDTARRPRRQRGPAPQPAWRSTSAQHLVPPGVDDATARDTWARAVADACVGRTRRAAADVLDVDLRTLYRWLPELRVVAPTIAARLDDRDAAPVDR